MIVQPDFSNDFCSIKDSEHSFGFLPDWHGECCSDLHDPEEPLLEDDIFERLTGEQISLYNREVV